MTTARKTYCVKEKETGIYSFTLTDEAGVAVGGSTLTTATLTLYEPESGTIVNSRNAQSIINMNDVSIDEAGLVTWSQRIADLTILDASRGTEVHRALFFFTWQDGLRGKPHEADFVIDNLGKLS